MKEGEGGRGVEEEGGKRVQNMQPQEQADKVNSCLQSL